jgi:CRISPR-associated protein Cmr1
MTALQLSYTVRFLCPAFLGNAEQSGQWRTPPFKALLRQWWRVAYAADHRFSVDVDRMRDLEGQLFGAAADAEGSNRSRVRIRLDRWDFGSLKGWQPTGIVRHPEVGASGQNIGSDLYLGYGPLKFERNVGTTLKANAAIQAGESATLRIALTPQVGDEQSTRITRVLELINLYGTLGGRSRNGWGSFVLEPLGASPALPLSLGATVLRPWRAGLGLDWPHAIGQDEKGALIWLTEEAFPDWKPAIRGLASIKIPLRTQFKFVGEKPPHPRPNERHWLSYPVTNHRVRDWGDKLRLPNSLRFKLRRDSRDPGKVRGVIFHVPCRPPHDFNPNSPAIQGVWERVHRFLDDPAQKLRRIAA